MNMTGILIKNGNVILKDRVLKGAVVSISGSKIVAVGKGLRLLRPPRFARGPRNDGVTTIDAKGCFVSSGFIDCHIHGEPKDIFSNEAKYGTTSFVIAQSCAPLKSIYINAQKIKEFIEQNPIGPNVLGIRLEGPYISKEKAGAQNKLYIRRPVLKELAEILRKIPILKIMTIAPELQDAQPLIKLLRKNGVIASMGHSDATYEEAIAGIDAGISHATHIFNAMSGIDRREPGAVGSVLMDDRVTTEIILDLVHVHRALFGLLVKTKRIDRVIIVTDSVAALEKNGDSPIQREIGALGQSPFFKAGGAYRFEDGRLAGSSLNMIDALKNAVKKCGLSFTDALRMITLNPAKLLGVDDKKGSIDKGKDADIVVFDKNFDVKATLIRGRMIYVK